MGFSRRVLHLKDRSRDSALRAVSERNASEKAKNVLGMGGNKDIRHESATATVVAQQRGLIQ